MSHQGCSKVPIPSFTPPPLRDAKETEVEVSDAALVEDQREMRLVDVHSLIRLDSALQLHCYKQEQQGKPQSDRIPFVDFLKISSKVETTCGMSLSQRNPTSEDSLGLWELSKAERLWHDVYCVAVPALYRVNYSTSHSSLEDDGSSPPTKKKRRLAALSLDLTLLPLAGATEGRKNRSKELRRLVREARTRGIPKVQSDDAFRRLLTFRRTKANYEHDKSSFAHADSDNNKTNKFGTVDSLLQNIDPSIATNKGSRINSVETNGVSTISTTIDDRIRARAKEREMNQKQFKAAQKDPRDERLAIADALYSYACHILRRRRSRSPRFSSHTANAPTMSPSKCMVTFKEVAKNGLPNRSRKDIARIMSDIVQVLSESSTHKTEPSTSLSAISRFLKWKDPKTGKDCGFPISKNALVTINTTCFKNVREVLNQERFPDSTGQYGKK